MSWFTRKEPNINPPDPDDRHKGRTEGLWLKCDGCRQIIFRKNLEENMNCCPKCGHHFRIDATQRLKYLFDDGQYQEVDQHLQSTDPLHFVDSKSYSDRLAAMRESTGLNDSVISAVGTIHGR